MPQRDELFTVQEAAALLKVHPATIYKAVEAKTMGHVRVMGRSIRLTRKHIEQLMTKHEAAHGRPVIQARERR